MGKVKILSDRFMQILASKTKFKRMIITMLVLAVIIISGGAVYLLLKDLF